MKSKGVLPPRRGPRGSGVISMEPLRPPRLSLLPSPRIPKHLSPRQRPASFYIPTTAKASYRGVRRGVLSHLSHLAGTSDISHVYDRAGHGLERLSFPERTEQGAVPTEQVFRDARAAISSLLGQEDLVAGSTIVDSNGMLRASLLPPESLNLPAAPRGGSPPHFRAPASPQLPSPPKEAPGLASPRLKTMAAPPDPGRGHNSTSDVGTGRIGALQLWHALAMLRAQMPDEETLDLVASELARQSYVHCAERGLLVEHVRNSTKILIVALQKQLAEAEVEAVSDIPLCIR